LKQSVGSAFTGIGNSAFTSIGTTDYLVGIMLYHTTETRWAD
jgi:hypothetical protein